MYFDRFDIVEAHYLYCMDYHMGQFSDLYQRLCRIVTKLGYRPRPTLKYETLGKNAQMIYDRLAGKV